MCLFFSWTLWIDLIFYINVYVHSFISVLTKAWIIKGTMAPIQNTIKWMSFWVKADYLAKWFMGCSTPDKTGSTWNLSKLLRMEKCVAKKGFFTISQAVQSLSWVWLFAIPWTAVCQASLSITNSRSPLKPMSIESVMPSSHLILSSPSPPVLNLSQHQGLLQTVSSLHQVAKVLEFTHH